MKKSYKINVNQNIGIELNADDLANFDFVKEADGSFHILKNGTAYRAKFEDVDFTKKTFSIKINNNTYQIDIQDKFDQLVEKMGLSVADTQKAADVKAPMPGLVLEVNVEVGQDLQKGDGLLILEAMKMENVIKSVGEGIVKAIHINKGEAVEKGQLMIEME